MAPFRVSGSLTHRMSTEGGEVLFGQGEVFVEGINTNAQNGHFKLKVRKGCKEGRSE